MGCPLARRFRWPRCGQLSVGPYAYSRNHSLLLILSLYIAAFSLFLLYGLFLCRGLLYSTFYDQAEQDVRLAQRDTANEASAARYMEALIERYRVTDDNVTSTTAAVDDAFNITDAPAPTMDLCAVMVTAPRERRYLYQSLASILRSNCHDGPIHNPAPLACSPLSSKLPSFHLNVLYTHTRTHADFTALTKAHIPHLTVVHRTNGTSSHFNWYKKGLRDYAAALQLCLEDSDNGKDRARRPHVTMVLEDDVVTTRNVIDKVAAGVEPLIGRSDWLLVRLYRSSFWDGWEVNDWPVVVMLSVLGGVAGVVLAFAFDAYLCVRPPLDVGPNKGRSPSRGARECQYLVVGVVTVCSALITAAVLLLLNRQNVPLFRARSGLSVDDSSAGTVALLFPTAQLTRLLTFLHSPTLSATMPLDNALNQYAEETGLKQWLLVPNLFDHRGVYSSSASKNQGSYQELKVSSTFFDEVDLGHFP